MFYGLINWMGETYKFLSKARGICQEEEIKTVANAAFIMVDKADKVIPALPGAPLDKTDQMDLDEVRMMRDHIEEMMIFQLSQEIV